MNSTDTFTISHQNIRDAIAAFILPLKGFDERKQVLDLNFEELINKKDLIQVRVQSKEEPKEKAYRILGGKKGKKL